MRQLIKTDDVYRVCIKDIAFDKGILVQILNIGLPSGLQNSIISIANVVVQANINAFGSAAMAGCGAYFKIEGFVFLPITCFSMALTTFISQNLGAGQTGRVKGSLFWNSVWTGTGRAYRSNSVYIYSTACQIV